MIQIEIPRRSPACALGQEPLKEGMTYFSVLEGEEPLVRRDYCEACWSQAKSGSHKIYWKAKVPPKKREAPQAADLSGYAFILLKEALQSQCEEEAFVLALYLARKKKLLLRDEFKNESGKISLYEVAETEEMIPVKKLELSTFKTEEIQESLAKKFKAWTKP